MMSWTKQRWCSSLCRGALDGFISLPWLSRRDLRHGFGSLVASTSSKTEGWLLRLTICGWLLAECRFLHDQISVSFGFGTINDSSVVPMTFLPHRVLGAAHTQTFPSFSNLFARTMCHVEVLELSWCRVCEKTSQSRETRAFKNMSLPVKETSRVLSVEQISKERSLRQW